MNKPMCIVPLASGGYPGQVSLDNFQPNPCRVLGGGGVFPYPMKEEGLEARLCRILVKSNLRGSTQFRYSAARAFQLDSSKPLAIIFTFLKSIDRSLVDPSYLRMLQVTDNFIVHGIGK